MEVRTAPLPSLSPLGAEFPAAHPSLPYTSPHHQHLHPLASLTSHFDGHGLLGANKVDDLLMGTRGDGIPVDPDNLIPYLAINKRNKHQVEGVSRAHCQMPRGLFSRKGDDGQAFPQETLMCALVPCHNQPSLHQSEGPQGVGTFKKPFCPILQLGDTIEGHRDWVAEVGGELKTLSPHSGVPFTPLGHHQALESK